MEQEIESGTVRRLSILKIPVDVVALDSLPGVVDSLASDGKLHHIAFITLYDLMRARRDKAYRSYLEQASLVLPISRGIVRGAAFLGLPKPDRYLPYDFVIRILSLLEERRRSVYLLGARRDTLLVSEKKLKQTFPGLRIVGRYSGYYRKQEESDIFLAIRKASPTLLLAGNGIPGKEKWIRRNRHRLSSGMLLWCADCFEIFAEKKKRIKRSAFEKGREYLPGLLRRPWRLARGGLYLYYLFLLLVYRIREKRATRKKNIRL